MQNLWPPPSEGAWNLWPPPPPIGGVWNLWPPFHSTRNTTPLLTNNGHSQNSRLVEDKVYSSCISHEHQYIHSTCHHTIKAYNKILQKEVSTHPFERITSMTLDFTFTRFVHKPNCNGTAFHCYFDAECKATPKTVWLAHIVILVPIYNSIMMKVGAHWLFHYMDWQVNMM